MISSIAQGIQFAREKTQRSKILSLISDLPDPGVESIAPLQLSCLCRAIGESEERIAAILVGAVSVHPLILNRFLKRVSELASAEGALLIWGTAEAHDLLSNLEIKPDLICKTENIL